jgi:hypothetical protein
MPLQEEKSRGNRIDVPSPGAAMFLDFVLVLLIRGLESLAIGLSLLVSTALVLLLVRASGRALVRHAERFQGLRRLGFTPRQALRHTRRTTGLPLLLP